MAFPQTRVFNSSITASPNRHTTRRLSSAAAHYCLSPAPSLLQQSQLRFSAMASSLLAPLKRICTTTATSPLMLGFGVPTRRPFSCDMLGPIFEEAMNMTPAVSPNVVTLESSFGNSSSRVGNGVFVRPWLIVTSAHVVGRVTGFNCEIGRTTATAEGGKVLRTRPLAVNFGGDVAVLHVVGDSESTMPAPPSLLAYEVGCKELPLTVVTRSEENKSIGALELKVRGAENLSPRTEWVYPVGDDFGWVRYGSGEDDPVVLPGSPWFSLVREVVGIASWAVGEEPHGVVGSFVVPPPRIRAALDYATGKGDQDPLVMDRWIEKVTAVADGCDDRIIGSKECGSKITSCRFVVSMYLPESLFPC